MALCGVGIGAEKNQLCAVVADDNRVAGQVDVTAAPDCWWSATIVALINFR